MNPDWEHWFWTLDDARKLIETQYPRYLVLYDSYISSIFRAGQLVRPKIINVVNHKMILF